MSTIGFNVFDVSARQLLGLTEAFMGKPALPIAFEGTSAIELGPMLATVTVVPAAVEMPRLAGYGDETILSRMFGSVTNQAGVTRVTAPLPLIGGGEFELPAYGGHQINYMQQDGRYRFEVNGREVDLTRAVHLVLTIPADLGLKTSSLFGALGVAPGWNGNLDVNGWMARAYAMQARSLQGDVGSSSSIEVEMVLQGVSLTGGSSTQIQLGDVGHDCKLDLSSSARVRMGAVAGNLRLEASSSVRASAGNIGGNAKLRLGSSTEVTLASVRGGLDLDGSSSTRTRVGAVTGNAKIRLGSSSFAEVTRVGGNLNLDGGTNTEVLVGDVAGEASIDAGTSSRITVWSVSGRVTAECGTNAHCIIKGGTSTYVRVRRLGTSSSFRHLGQVLDFDEPEPGTNASAEINGQTYAWSPFGRSGGRRSAGTVRTPRPPRGPQPPAPPAPPVPPTPLVPPGHAELKPLGDPSVPGSVSINPATGEVRYTPYPRRKSWLRKLFEDND